MTRRRRGWLACSLALIAGGMFADAAPLVSLRDRARTDALRNPESPAKRAGVREELETERDAFTFAPTTTGANTSILEASYSFIDNRTGPESHSFPEVLVRRGIGERWSLHAEYFAILTSEKETPLNIQYASFGGHVLATEDLEIGLRVGWGLNETTPAFFSNVGLGLRY